jgi:hypothetical protein
MLIKEPYSELFPINNASSLDDRSSSCFRMPGLSDKSTPKSAMKSLPISGGLIFSQSWGLGCLG